MAGAAATMSSSVLASAAILLLVMVSSSGAAVQLYVGYYNKTCPKVEQIVRAETTRMVRASPDLAAALLRLHYHDCFVQGCDASVLLDSTPGNTAEKDARPNGSLRGFDSVARVKAQLEDACPGVVSCADVLALMARDAVALARGPSWPVALGRRDGRSSSSASCGELAPLVGDVNAVIEAFAAKGLDVKDLVVLSGGHTLGKAHCPSYSDRLYSGGTNCSTDPVLDVRYADRLRMRCTSAAGQVQDNNNNTSSAASELDPGSCVRFDTSYYRHVAKRRGLLRSDASLLDHRYTRAYVLQAASGRYDGHFFKDFAESMVKMASIGVLTGHQGEIRKQCNVVN
jgi:peroxidase